MDVCRKSGRCTENDEGSRNVEGRDRQCQRSGHVINGLHAIHGFMKTIDNFSHRFSQLPLNPLSPQAAYSILQFIDKHSNMAVSHVDLGVSSAHASLMFILEMELVILPITLLALIVDTLACFQSSF